MSADSVRAPRYGVVDPAQRSSVSGVDFLKAIIDGRVPLPPIMETMAITPISVTHGEVVMHGAPEQRHLNPLGSVHGGYGCTLLDSVMGCAVHSTLEIGQGYTTVELKVNFTRPILPGMRVRGVGTVVNRGRQLAIADGRILAEGGKLLAHATTTCLLFAMPARAAA
ncbi:PaaI family thioesterase [Solimonas terrae]|uniref:PaaI family thioesterase n=1 Tax=Solimonas terrae TaxID=1396819 RepID=A0A6M2BMZ3_9GAMM|nr:PaaI family thioesterase [Solimonas terrae]NGY03660.1 PaaI family thioesterase [Solimonas terrae]